MSVSRSTVAERKGMPLASGVLDYFPDALLVVAEVSRIGNEQHHPGEPLHWDKSKSSDEADALMRHLLDRGTVDTDGVRHSAKVAWRALALLQRELDAEAAAELATAIDTRHPKCSCSACRSIEYEERCAVGCYWCVDSPVSTVSLGNWDD